MVDFVQNLQRLSEAKTSYVLVTLTAIRGSAPQIVGAKMLVQASGLVWGTVGGGKVEAACIEHARELLLQQGRPEMRTWNLQKDIGMSCGGEVTFFFDPILFDKWHIAIFGAGHIAQELCRVLQTWSCQISIFDTREEWLARLPDADNLKKKCSRNLASEVGNLPKGSYLLCMTQGHATDVPIVLEALNRADELSFVGVIGSDVKAAKLRRELLGLGVAQENLDRLRSPLGLPIGNDTPPEISISIAAQLLVLRDGTLSQFSQRFAKSLHGIDKRSAPIA